MGWLWGLHEITLTQGLAYQKHSTNVGCHLLEGFCKFHQIRASQHNVWMQGLSWGALKGLWESSWGPQGDPAGTGILRKCALPRVTSLETLRVWRERLAWSGLSWTSGSCKQDVEKLPQVGLLYWTVAPKAFERFLLHLNVISPPSIL